MTLRCVASSSSDSPMTTAWRKDGEVLYDAEVQNYARYQDGELIYTTVLHVLNVNFTDEGRYQCVVSNHFGSNYSNRAKLTVNGKCFNACINTYAYARLLNYSMLFADTEILFIDQSVLKDMVWFLSLVLFRIFPPSGYLQ